MDVLSFAVVDSAAVHDDYSICDGFASVGERNFLNATRNRWVRAGHLRCEGQQGGQRGFDWGRSCEVCGPRDTGSGRVIHMGLQHQERTQHNKCDPSKTQRPPSSLVALLGHSPSAQQKQHALPRDCGGQAIERFG